jgi:diguanylate cyclase (GGDEF)-like protein/PAS domain S-box-containing protein
MRKQEEASHLALTGAPWDSELLELLAAALEAADTAVVIVDRDRTIVWANPALEQLTGYTPQEVIGKSTPAFWSSQQSPAFYEELWATLLSGKKWRGELVNQHKDGSFYDENRSITPIRDARGEVTHFIAIRRDISARKRAERDVRRLVQVVEKTPNFVGMADLEGKIFFVNQAFYEALGYAKEDLPGKHFSTIIAESNPPNLVQDLVSGMYQPAGWAGEVQVRRQDGSDLSVLLTLQPLTDGQGAVTGSFGVARDVTEIKRAEEALRQSHEMFEALFESSPDAMLAVDVDGRIVRLNFQVERLFGYSRGELLGQPVEKLIPEHSRLAHPERSLDHHSQVRAEESELRGRRKDGNEFPVEIGLSLLQTQTGNLVVSVIRDVSLRKQADKALKETHDRLNRALRNAERQSREAAKLSELVDILQSCQSLREAYEITASTLRTTLSYLAGAVCITGPSHNLVEVTASWGDSPVTEKTFRPEDCWALRRNRVHQVKDPSSPLRCGHVRGNPPGGYFCVPLTAQSETFGVLYMECSPETAADPAPRERRADHVDIEVRQATALGERLSLAFGNLRLREALRTQSIRDPLTNLFNRRYMEESLEREMARSARGGEPVALLLLDIDHFKNFNDTFGHQGGDTLLRTLGEFLSQRTRGQDVACRYGGEEFAIILSGASKESAQQRAQLLREDLKHMMVEHAGQIVSKITFSIGVAVAPEHGSSASELLRAADASLYRAKEQGRDRIVVA